ncbi:MAG: hypothetical protein ABRQ25_17645 [Clostridiaceae bacterium]
METVIAERENMTLVKIQNKRELGGKIYNTLRYEIRLDNEYYRGFSGCDESKVLESFNIEADRAFGEVD